MFKRPGRFNFRDIVFLLLILFILLSILFGLFTSVLVLGPSLVYISTRGVTVAFGFWISFPDFIVSVVKFFWRVLSYVLGDVGHGKYCSWVAVNYATCDLP